MQRQIERGPVNGQQRRLCSGQIQMCLNRLFRIHVDIGPRRVVGADRQQGEVEGPVRIANHLERLGVSRIAAEEDLVLRSGEGPGSPQRGVAGDRSTGEVSGLGAGERQLSELMALIPVELDDPRR
ncbi:Uncharacterised protein [Mycobacteroides abscessus subsp. massiliense]|nr:Uncharacterised protein [Mycobacteroides abscessus subsp. massiliense]